MSQPYIGEIRLFAGNFAPQNYAICDGSLLSIASNTALFSLLGTTYGGNGTTTFALPDLRSRVPVHQGTGQSNYVIGMSRGKRRPLIGPDAGPPTLCARLHIGGLQSSADRGLARPRHTSGLRQRGRQPARRPQGDELPIAHRRRRRTAA
jgi:hypothetical protein